MAMSREKKRALAAEVLDLFAEFFDIQPLGAYAERCLAASALPARGVR
jgi:hypothetical protein